MKERTQRKGELNERIPYDNVIPIGRIRNLITFCCVVNVRVRATRLRPRLEVRFASDFVIRFPVELLARRAAVCRRLTSTSLLRGTPQV